MRLLLDTHVFLWSLAMPSKLSTKARQLIEKADVYVSAASIWEISIKSALGKLAAHPADVLAAVEPTGFAVLPISGEHAAAVRDLPPHHRDPFDRLLVAQARTEPMHLLTNDGMLRAYGDVIVVM